LIAACLGGGLCNSQRLPIVSWQVSAARITLHEPVLIRLTVNNQTNEVVMLDLRHDYKEGLRVTIITPSGTVLNRPPLEPGDGLHAIGRVTLEPGGNYSREYVMDEWYDFYSPGQYEISVDLRLPITVGDRSVSLPGERFQSVTIDPYDQDALRRRCEALLSRVLQPVLYYDSAARADADQAMWALSYIRDPVTIPYLARALASPDSGSQLLAVRTLEKFLTPESVNVLILYAKGNTTWTSQAASTLHRMEQLVQDPALRDRIRAALNEVPSH